MFEDKGSVNIVLKNYYNDGTIPEVWYDWFCKDSQLERRGKRLMKILAFFVAKEKLSEKYLSDKYVFFKNNCPLVGKLYDQLSICEMGTGTVIYVIQDQVNEDRGRGVWLYSGTFDDSTKQLLAINR